MSRWFENLPENCPPKEAFIPKGFICYRLSNSENISDEQFFSHRKLKPSKVFNNIPECIARSVSVFDSFEECQNMVKLPRHKKRWKKILELNLHENDGRVLKTFSNPNHYSWWRSISFTFASVKLVQ